MKETLHKPTYLDLDDDQLSKIINEKYAENPDLQEISKELNISVSIVFEATGCKNYYEFLVDKE